MKFEPEVVTCLTVPGPSSGSRYRVTQRFDVRPVDSGGTLILDFEEKGGSVNLEDEASCGMTK